MAKKKTTNDVSFTVRDFFREVWHGVCAVFRALWSALKHLAEAIWELVLRLFRLGFHIWAFGLATILTVALTIFLLSASIRQLDNTNLMGTFLEQSDGVIELYMDKLGNDLQNWLLDKNTLQ